MRLISLLYQIREFFIKTYCTYGNKYFIGKIKLQGNGGRFGVDEKTCNIIWICAKKYWSSSGQTRIVQGYRFSCDRSPKWTGISVRLLLIKPSKMSSSSRAELFILW
jgi:hypothetical protein